MINIKTMKIACQGESCGECGFRSTVFDCLSNIQIESLAEGKDLIKSKKGEVIIKQGDPIRHFIFLRVGLAKLTRVTQDGKVQIVGIARPKDFVGLLSVFSSPNHQFSIIAIEDSEFCIVDFNLIKRLIGENGTFAQSLLEKISQVSDLLINGRLELDSRQIRGRIAYMLCYFANDVYQSGSFNLPVSRKEIAELIDMRIENVVRVLSEFRKDNIIKIEGTNIEIIQHEKLEWIKNHG